MIDISYLLNEISIIKTSLSLSHSLTNALLNMTLALSSIIVSISISQRQYKARRLALLALLFLSSRRCSCLSRSRVGAYRFSTGTLDVRMALTQWRKKLPKKRESSLLIKPKTRPANVLAAQLDMLEEHGVLDGRKIRYRPMKLKDCAACYHLGLSLFQFSISLSRTFDQFALIGCYTSEPAYCLVAELADTDTLVGFALGSTIEKKQQKCGYLNWVAVHLDYQRMGVGSALVKRIERVMLDKERVTMYLVDTPVENYAAICFLQKLGYGEPIEQVYLCAEFTLDGAPTVPGNSGTPAPIASEPAATATSTSAEAAASVASATSSSSSSDLSAPSTPATPATPGPLVLDTAELPPAALGDSSKKRARDGDADGAGDGAAAAKRHMPQVNIEIRQMTLDDIWSVFQIGELVFTEVRPNLYRLWDEVCQLLPAACCLASAILTTDVRSRE